MGIEYDNMRTILRVLSNDMPNPNPNPNGNLLIHGDAVIHSSS